jgi:zinc ribbon protein
MAFCVSCGTSLAEGTHFCSKCGAAVPDQAGSISTQPVTPAVQPTGGGSNTAIKVIFAILGFFVFVGLLAFGSCFYIGYRVKQRASQFSHEMGADAPRYTGKRQPCAMLSKEEVSQAIGQPVASVEQIGTNACQYHYGPGGTQTLPIQYTWEGGAMMLKIEHGAMKSVAAGMDTFTPISGVGDEAYFEPAGSGLAMRKGDVMVHMDLRVANVSTEAAKSMAEKIAGRL